MNRWKLEFRHEDATLPQVREYLARVAAALGCGATGSWEVSAREGTRTRSRLGAATLLETITEDRAERPGTAFIIDLVASWTGSDHAPRRLRFGGWFASLQFLYVNLELEGFTAAEFLEARALGGGLFTEDATATVSGARDNVRQALRLGERSLAQRLLDEALARPQRPDQQHLVRELEAVRAELAAAPEQAEVRALLARPLHAEAEAAALVEALRARGALSEARVVCEQALTTAAAEAPWPALRRLRRAKAELALSPVERALAERDALLGEPGDSARLEQVAAGALEVRDWKPEAARRVLAMMRPWLPASSTELGAVAAQWRAAAPGWLALKHRSGVREPASVRFEDAVAALQRALKLADVQAAWPQGDGVAFDLVETERLVVRAVIPKLRAVVFHEADGVRWAWLWTGGLEGAVLASGPDGTRLAWLGEAKRFGSYRAALSREVKKLVLEGGPA